ncbi:MAG: BlaI/MecI/CopY family transcriptional regulator [Chloroflexi bacterium]|nr:BlaI/MecI/CopY family transcriptional regulator [Chloroflexota bacterium]
MKDILTSIRFRFNQKGMARVLGFRQAEVMEVLWQRGPATVAEVHGVINSRQPIAYTTVMTIMSRLANRGFLHRSLANNAYLYWPQVSREEMAQSLVKSIIDGLLQDFGMPAVAYFVHRLKEDDLAELERLVKEKKEESP